MSSEQDKRGDTIFQAALDLKADDRPAYLDLACAGDEELRREVESLLAAYERAGSFMERPAIETDAAVVAGQQPGSLVGRTIQHYPIIRLLAAGGMGEVYLARDTQLDRTIALKILPAELAANQERMRRFVQEARSAAALNHPYIAHIYEIGESKGVSFIAMEYVEGETLGEKIHRAKTDLRRLLEWLGQTADGLAKAHAAGILHRDLKPDNIMITREGYAKILDFGLAKLVEPPRLASAGGAASEAATALISPLSHPGIVMGTVGYMSPEQAQGKEVDLRSDIFSFGCILFEAATSRRPFEGDSIIASLHKTVYEPAPPLRELNPAAPPELQRIVRRCLMKDPDERYQTIKEVVIELKELRLEMDDRAQLHGTGPPAQTGGADASTALTHQQTPPAMGVREPVIKETPAPRSTSSAEYIAHEIKRHKRGALVVLALVIVAFAAAGYGAYKYYGSRKKSPSLSAMSITRLTTTGRATVAAISPDDRYVVYASSDGGRQSLWMRQTATQSNVEIVAPAEVEYLRLIFSPDGNYLFFVTRANGVPPTLYQIPALGGPQITPKKLSTGVGYMALSPDASQIVFMRNLSAEGAQALMISNVDGSAERRLAVLKLPARAFILGGGQRAPAWSPDGKTIACPLSNIGGGVVYSVVVAIDVASGQEKPIGSQKFFSVRHVAWLADGSGLLVGAVDQAAALQTVGPGREQIWLLSYPEGEARRITNDLNSYQTISLTADARSFVTVQDERTAAVWVAPQADAARAREITNGAGRVDLEVRWTPGGKILFASNASGQAGIWMMDADGGNQKQLTTEDAEGFDISPEGSFIAFMSVRTGGGHIFLMDAGGGNVRQLTNGSGEFGPTFSPGGKWVLYASRAAGDLTLWRVPVAGGEPQQVTDKRSYNPRVSPDGKWLATAYREDKPNAIDKVAIIPFDGDAPIKLFDITIGGGWQDLHWTADSRALIYTDARGGISNLWQQPVEGGPPKQLTDFKSGNIFSFDYSHDGKQLAISRGTINDNVVLVSNFK